MTLTVRDATGAVAIDVADEGCSTDAETDIFARGVSPQGGSGMGLAFACEIAVDNGGRLRLNQRVPTTRFTLLLLLADANAPVILE